MQALAWTIRIAIVLVLVWFALRNSHVVALHGLPGYSWQLPLVIIALVAFVTGVAIGLLAWLPTVFRQRREATRLRSSRQEDPPAAPAEPPAVSRGQAPESHGV